MSAGARRLAAWALFAAFVLHNLEEALTMEDFLAGVGAAFLYVPFLVAVTLVTALGLVLAVLSTRREPVPWALAGMRILALVLVINVVVPHLPAAVAFGYAPGVVTAVLLTLPLGVAYLVLTRPRAGSR